MNCRGQAKDETMDEGQHEKNSKTQNTMKLRLKQENPGK